MSNKKKVLVLGPMHEEGMKLLRSRDDVEFQVLTDITEENILANMDGVNGIAVRVAQINRKIIEASPDLQVVSRHGVGYDAVDQQACTDNGVALVIAPRSNAPSVAEQAMMFLLAIAKQMPALDAMTRAGNWKQRDTVKPIDIEGRTMLVIGLGRIGSRLVQRAQAFGMRVLGYDACMTEEQIKATGAEYVADFRAALGETDVVSVHCPRTEETIGLIGAAEMAAMPQGSIVLNCARGGIVDEPALLAAVQSGHIRGAGLDVFDVEPAGADHIFMDEPRILMTPHTAGISLEASMRSSYQTMENILACFDGNLDPDVVINKEVLK
jgi:D-3-phosphoglycerate dehydrogenase